MANMYVATIDLTSGLDYYTVVTNFGFVPTAMVCLVGKPVNEENVFATLRDGTLLQTGFTVDFSTTIPNVGYKLGYIVLL